MSQGLEFEVGDRLSSAHSPWRSCDVESLCGIDTRSPSR